MYKNQQRLSIEKKMKVLTTTTTNFKQHKNGIVKQQVIVTNLKKKTNQ